MAEGRSIHKLDRAETFKVYDFLKANKKHIEETIHSYELLNKYITQNVKVDMTRTNTKRLLQDAGIVLKLIKDHGPGPLGIALKRIDTLEDRIAHLERDNANLAKAFHAIQQELGMKQDVFLQRNGSL